MKPLYKCQACKRAPCSLIDKGLTWCASCWLADALGGKLGKINNIAPLETSESSTI
jgi:hypothetical protein